MTNRQSQILLSFIVPVYNVAPFLRKCVDSLLAQDYEAYEIILVNDGSTDGSGAICDEYAHVTNERVNELTNERIRVIHQENAGPGAARNTGVAAAKGKYTCFLDGDDYWQPNVLGELMAQAEREQLDVLRFDYQNVRIKNEGVKELMNEREYEVFEPNKYTHQVDTCHEVVDGETYLNERMGYACYPWQFIIKREIVSRFPANIHFTEDVDWLSRSLLQALRVNSAPTIVYNYFVRQGSITQVQGNKEKIRKNTADRMAVIANLVQLRIQHPNCQWICQMYSGMAIDILTVASGILYSERYVYIESLKKLKVFPLLLTNQNKTYTTKGVLANMSPYLAVWILHLKNRFLKQ